MAREKVGITLTPATIERLNEISEEMGLSKSQAIAMLINNYYINNKKGDRNSEK
ncbi:MULTISPECIES: ribbon-helix-helix protein, CopG family [Bacteria]|uniref:ribbon-helix-helix protein, CopG family n=1 Tax=Bacteria TaxID=2 RepID=UPI00024E12A9|nr:MULTISPECIES: ribbon-helix-helix protein, CopG family [Bacteria]MDU2180643.1 ribbon-helix-helix protein, CopG family [Escherichia coli]MDU4602344.1 ribbon-helix-helix protein, CopG family [Staphylococcus warneri]EHR87355.1 putative protein CopG [Staphylococcus epidermidis VCU118]MCH4477472.1 ribbon-helix-helix protein, CopG family [Staphylococcus haemolyticus]PAH40352.1 CopG family transcriptional regulator [Staphylococcus aureus]